MALGVIYDLQQELPVVVVDLLRPQRTVVIDRQQVPAVHLWERGHTSAQSLKCATCTGTCWYKMGQKIRVNVFSYIKSPLAFH